MIMPDVYEVRDLGIERGLTVVMDPLLDDYFYTIMPIVGWKASKNDITCYLINQESKTVISNIPHFREFHFISEPKLNLTSRENYLSFMQN